MSFDPNSIPDCQKRMWKYIGLRRRCGNLSETITARHGETGGSVAQS